MKIDTLNLVDNKWVGISSDIEDKNDAQIVFVFGDSDIIKNVSTFETLKNMYPNANVVGASSAGNILGPEVNPFSVVATAVKFTHSRVETSYVEFEKDIDLEVLSKNLIEQLPQEGLKHIFVLSNGLEINGSELVSGINLASKDVTVTGGLAGDGARFQETWIIKDAPAKQKEIAAIGFYGEKLSISSGTFSGWSEFGTERKVTKSKDNVLFELDNEPALDLYKRYLGEYAKELPNSGLRFPLSIKENENDLEVIRTLLGINEDEKSITFAGNVPEGYTARLMKPEIDMLINGAGEAAKEIDRTNTNQALGLVVSCVGRKIIMDQLVDEELEEVADVLGDNVHLTGFYSYGEMAPFSQNNLHCELHNQTMTLTVIYEED